MKATDINLKKRHLEEQSIYLMLLNDKTIEQQIAIRSMNWSKLDEQLKIPGNAMLYSIGNYLTSSGKIKPDYEQLKTVHTLWHTSGADDVRNVYFNNAKLISSCDSGRHYIVFKSGLVLVTSQLYDDFRNDPNYELKRSDIHAIATKVGSKIIINRLICS